MPATVASDDSSVFAAGAGASASAGAGSALLVPTSFHSFFEAAQAYLGQTAPTGGSQADVASDGTAVRLGNDLPPDWTSAPANDDVVAWRAAASPRDLGITLTPAPNWGDPEPLPGTPVLPYNDPYVPLSQVPANAMTILHYRQFFQDPETLDWAVGFHFPPSATITPMVAQRGPDRGIAKSASPLCRRTLRR